MQIAHRAEFLVNQGAHVAVTITWDPSTFMGSNVNRVRDCVHSSNTLWGSPYGSGGHLGTQPNAVSEPTPNSGTFATSYIVTQKPGTAVCDWAEVSGVAAAGIWNDGTEQSDELCLIVEMPAVTPEAPSVLLLPASAGLVGLGAFLLDRRRRARATTD